MEASSSTAGEIKYALRNDSDGLRIALAGGAFDTIIPSASTFVASPSGTKLTPYDVFINHCGQDVKPTLASRIYESLNSTGLRVFLDKPELKYGDLLPKAFENAMATASIYIAIFSEHYAESPWCLAELEYMVKTRKTIIPIFYHVQPSVLRWADGGKGAYADAFSEHVKKSRYAPEVLQQWKQALQEVSCCIGDIVNNIDDEQRVVKNVVNRVMKVMKMERLHVADHPVGLDEAVQDFDTFQSASSGNFIGIWGMGGSGKTTLAKEIFNRRSSNMDWSSFLSDVRDAAGKRQLLEKQKKLLKDLDFKNECPDNLDDGKQILKNRLSTSVSVLIVLDDVDHREQVGALLPPRESLGTKSLIIVTTRDKDVLQQLGMSAIFPMKPLNAAHAKQLFCWHAFLLNSPPPEFKDLVEEFLKACPLLPLSLKVLGGLLYGKSDNDYWQRTLNKFSQIPHADIKKTLKISYDALEKDEQEMFLDAACLFIGQRKSAVIEAWDAEENWDGSLGWESLFNKCLVEEDKDGLVRMHDHLRDLGRDIANGQSPHRLWSAHRVIEIPPQQDAIVRVRGIANAVGDNCYQRQGKIIINTNQEECSLAPSSLGLKIFLGNGEFLSQELSQLSKKLIWLQCNKFEHKNLPSWLALKELRILELSDSRSLEHLWTENADAPLQLTELVIRECESLAGFPRSIGHLKNLKRILINDNYYTSCDALSDLPQEFCYLQSLEHLEMRECPNLSSLPTNFGKLTKLRHLNLACCTKLEALPDSFKKLTLLEYLSLESCRELTIKSELNVFENMTKLRYLNLEGCKKLEDLRLPESVSLRDLHLKETGLKELPANIFHRTKLTKLEIGSDFLTTLPTCVPNLSPLTTLTIEGCIKLESLPDSLENLTDLRDLTMEDTGVQCLPKSLIHHYITSLQKLVIYEYPILDGLQGLAELTSLKEFELEGCEKLEKIESLEHLKSLEKLTISFCPELEVLPSLPETTSLKEFQLKGCHKLEKVKGLGNIRCLQELMIYDCPISEGLQGLAKLTSLKKIELQRCNKLEKIESLEYLKSLEKLNISDCPELEVLASVPETISLKEIKLKRCHKLEKVGSLKNIRSLEKLTICDCPKLDGLQDLTKLTSLKYIKLRKCNKLQKIESLENIRLLKELKITDCPELEAIASHSETLRSLERVSICDCPRLGGLLSLAELPSLKTIELSKCPKLKKLKICNCPQLDVFFTLDEFTSLEEFELQRCPKLWRLSIDDCPQLVDLLSLAELPSLDYISLRNCSKLKKIEALENLKSLEKLRISDSPELATIKITSLKKLELENCYKSEKIECWKHLKSLEELRLSDCSELEVLPEITSLKILELEKWQNKIEGLENMRSLEKLSISDCSELETLPEITSLKILELERCPRLKKIEGLGNMSSLEELNISDCSELETLPEITSLKIFELERCPRLKKIEGLGNMRSLEKLSISDCSELETLPEITSLERLELKRCPRLKKIEGLGNMRSLRKLIISDCSELESLPGLSEITSLKKLKLKKCYKLEKVEGLERLTLLQKLKVHSCSTEPFIVSLEHSWRWRSLFVVANNISAVEPFVSSIQEWPRKVIICTRPVGDMGLLKNFFQKLTNVSGLDYTDVVEVDSYYGGKHLELGAPQSSANGNAILRCFIIHSDHRDLRFSIQLGPYFSKDFNTELGEGKWVWMGVSSYSPRWQSVGDDYICARNSKGEDVKVRVEAAWFARGEEESIVDAFRQYFQRWPRNELTTEEASATVDVCQ